MTRKSSMDLSLFVVVLALLFLNSPYALFAQEGGTPVSLLEQDEVRSGILTPEERAWLKAHPTIRLAYPPGHEPTLMKDKEGKLVGVLADYYELINRRLETNLTLTLVPWLEVDKKIRTKEIEGLVVATSNKIEALGLLPTERKLSSYIVVYGRGSKGSLDFPDDLYGRRVAVLNGYNHTDTVVNQIRDKVEILLVESPWEGLEAVHQGRVDFFIGAISNNYLVSKYQFFGIGALHVFWDKPYRVGPAARSDLPELVKILEKGAGLVSDEEFDTLIARWTRVRRFETQVELTPDEHIWLAKNSDITLGYVDSHEPQLIVGRDGTLTGILVDLISELNRRLDSDIKLSAYPLKELLAKAKSREIDGICNLHPEYADKLGLINSKGYFRNYPVIFARQETPINGPEQIAGKTVAVLDKAYFSQKILDKYPGAINILKVENALEGLKSLESGTADMYIGVSHNTYLISKYQFYDIVTKYIFTDFSEQVVMAVQPDEAILAGILSKGLSSFTDRDLNGIIEKWVQAGSGLTPEEEVKRVRLTADERDWLAKHPDIELGYTDAFEPGIIVNEDGSYRGTLVDILKLLNQRLETDFKPTVKTIPDLISQVSKKELAGVLSIHSKRADKLGWLKTKRFMNSYPTIFIRKGGTFSTPADLAGKKIAIIDKVFFSQNLVDLYGAGSKIIKVKDGREGLETVRNGNADLYIGSSRNSYLLSKYQFYDLVASYQFYEHPTPNVMAVRNDWPQLVAILNKGLATISAEEIESILRKWGSHFEKQQVLNLTPEERVWLEANPRIGVGVFPVPPYMFSKNGRIQGYLVDLMEILVSQAGLTAGYSAEPLVKQLSRVESGELHTILGMIHSEEREGFMYFSENIMNMQMSIFARTSRLDISDAGSLKNKVIASYKGYGFEHALIKYLPNARIIRADDVEGMFRLVASGEADAAVQELHSGEYIVRDSFINGVSRKGSFAPPGLPTITGSEFGVSKKFPLLFSILTKSYNTLAEREKIQVWRKWFARDVDLASEKQITFAPEEQAWLEQNHTVRVRAADWPPFMLIKENEPPQGIAVEYLELIGSRTGITFTYEAKKQPFAEFVEGLKKGQGPDMTTLIVEVPEREEYLSFTAPYIFSPYVIFSRELEEILLDINSLAGKTVAVPRGFIMAELLGKDFPDIRTALFDSDEQALLALSTGQVQAYIGNLAVASQLIQKRGLTNLRVVAATPYGDQELSMGIRKDWPELASIIDKVLASMGEEEKTAIRRKYMAIRYEQGVDRTEVIQWILFLVVIAIAVLLLFIIWNWQLRRKVSARTADLEEEIIERKQAEERIRQYQGRLKSLASQLTVVEQAERRKIAAGLHDHIGQILAFSRLQLARAKKQAHDHGQLALLDDISQSLLHVIEDTKELIFDLSSPLLNEIGLDAAITDYLENHVEKEYGLEYSYTQENAVVELNELERTILFRNFKELVVNVVKHSQASKIDVRMGGDEKMFNLVVADDGLGFDPEQLEMKNRAKGGFGLFSIQEHMTDIGGTLDIDSGADKGCTITMKLPVYLNNSE